MIAGLALCRRAAIEIGHLDPIETLSAGDADFILGTLNTILDQWNADREAVYADVLTPFTLPASPAPGPYTIGPTGDLVMAARPVTIDGVVVVAGGLRTALEALPVAWGFTAGPSIGSPTAYAYNPTWPDGVLYLGAYPAAGTAIELVTRDVLTAITLAQSVTLPQGYEAALILTLAEQIAAPLGIAVPPATAKLAGDARARIFTNNRAPTPTLATRDAGMPGGRRGGGRNPMAGPGGGGWTQGGWTQ